MDQTWWIDVARLGSPDAHRVAVLCCGLNGAEGFCGSGILVSWLAENWHRELPRDVAIVLVHGVNPGPLITTEANTAATSRDSAVIPSPHASAQPAPQGWTDKVLAAAERRFSEYNKKNGALAESNTPSHAANIWVEKIFERIAAIVTGRADHVALVEFHTNLSEFGEVAVFSCHDSATAANGRIIDWFGAASSAQSDGPAFADALLMKFAHHLGPADLTAMVVEFGVYSTQSLLAIEPPKSTRDRRERYQRMFYPESPLWRENAAKEARSVIRRVVQGLDAL
jgi:hypothetical protein